MARTHCYHLLTIMSDAQKKIDAVEFLLASFRRNPNEAAKEKAIEEETTTNKHVDIYAEFSKAELKEQLVALQKQLNSE